MKANELMIGDWFHNNYTNENYQVWPTFFSQVTNSGRRLDATFEDINITPIPLTPEILEKNGFVKESKQNFGNNLQYCILTDGLWIDISGENFFEGKLEYVHQLQHALKLCGIEKIIEL